MSVRRCPSAALAERETTAPAHEAVLEVDNRHTHTQTGWNVICNLSPYPWCDGKAVTPRRLGVMPPLHPGIPWAAQRPICEAVGRTGRQEANVMRQSFLPPKTYVTNARSARVRRSVHLKNALVTRLPYAARSFNSRRILRRVPVHCSSTPYNFSQIAPFVSGGC